MKPDRPDKRKKAKRTFDEILVEIRERREARNTASTLDQDPTVMLSEAQRPESASSPAVPDDASVVNQEGVKPPTGQSAEVRDDGSVAKVGSGGMILPPLPEPHPSPPDSTGSPSESDVVAYFASLHGPGEDE